LRCLEKSSPHPSNLQRLACGAPATSPALATKKTRLHVRPWLAFGLALSIPAATRAAPDEVPQATLIVRAAERAPHPIPRCLTGKFAEHLGNNIYNGMSAQVLRNPTFADFPIWTGEMNPDGVTTFLHERDKITQELRRRGRTAGWPDADLDRLAEDYFDGLAAGWARVGGRDAVKASPDTAAFGQRAQRLEVKAAGAGIAQWSYLPLHRTRSYELELYLRSPDLNSLTIKITPSGAATPCATARVKGLAGGWRKLGAVLAVPADQPADAAYRLAIVADAPGQWVLGHAFLRPADHVQGADPDVVRLLAASRLPLLRWPGGNFVSGYHWEDGVGPLEQRPTKPNYAWGGVEPNLFGTDEFIAFCRAVGAEPMICLNAGSGTPEEAARWIEYCNGSGNSPLGKRRAANGHPEPYFVQHWEVGNELWGRWQFNWTSASGYVDRYHLFARAMLQADPNIRLYACGAPVMWGKEWNDTLIAGAAPGLRSITDHPLVGGAVGATVEPLDVFRDFMAVPAVLERKWAALREDLLKAGVREPRLAVTELQMFAHLGGRADANGPAKLTHNTLVNPGTLGEALYDVLIYHAAVRLDPFVEMVTHSATVNHGGGLRKERERVYANPCYYAQAAFAELAGATPVALDLQAASEHAPLVLPELRNATREQAFKTVDALAALAPNGDLLISIVHRAGAGSTRLGLELRDFAAGPTAQVRTLSGEVPWAANSLSAPTAIQPVDTQVAVSENKLALELKPYSVLRIRMERK
jgi:alpha-N-arabinofuranosidase